MQKQNSCDKGEEQDRVERSQAYVIRESIRKSILIKTSTRLADVYTAFQAEREKVIDRSLTFEFREFAFTSLQLV